MLGHFKREHGFKLVSFGLKLCNLPLQEINTGIWHLLQVVSINVFRASLEIVELLLEVLGCVIHINLQMVVLFAIDFEGDDEAHWFFWSQSINHCWHESLLIWFIKCLIGTFASFWLRHTIQSRLNPQLLYSIGLILILDCKKYFEMLTHTDLAKWWVKVEGSVRRYAIIADITLVHQILHVLWVSDLLHVWLIIHWYEWLILLRITLTSINLPECFFIIVLFKFVFELRTSQPFDRRIDEIIELEWLLINCLLHI